MTIHWKAVEQYFTVVLFVNPLTPRGKPWVTQSFLTFDSMDRTISVTMHWKAVKQYFTVVLLVFQLHPGCNNSWEIYKFWIWHCQELNLLRKRFTNIFQVSLPNTTLEFNLNTDTLTAVSPKSELQYQGCIS